MPRKAMQDFHPHALKAFAEAAHEQRSRRGFLQRAAQLAAAGVTGETLMLALNPRFAEAQPVPPSDPRLKTQ